MTFQCKNQNLWTWSDIICGKAICFKFLTLSVLFLLMIGTAISLYIEQKLNLFILANILFVILALVLTDTLMVFNQATAQSDYLKLTSNGIAFYKNGKRKAFDSFSSMKLQRASWTQNYQGLFPALEIDSAKLGVIRIGLCQENFQWLHLKDIFSDVHYTIHDQETWVRLEHEIKQYL